MELRRHFLKRSFAAAFVNVLFVAQALASTPQVQLTLAPSQTLPALPVTIRLSITNPNLQPIQIGSNFRFRVTKSDQVYAVNASFPTQTWSSEKGVSSSLTIQPGTTLTRLMPIEGYFGHVSLFYEPRLPFGVPGEYDIVIDVLTPLGALYVSSNAAHLSVSVPTGEDAAVWTALRERHHDDQLTFEAVRDGIDVLNAHPQSEYARRVLPLVAATLDTDMDRAASTLSAAVQSLPGAWIDAARFTVAERYADAASSASFRNDQALAGQLSAKGRVFTQQMIHSPGSPAGAEIGAALEARLLTTEQWQQGWDATHQSGGAIDIHPIIECRQPNGDGTYTWSFGYESQSSNDVPRRVVEQESFTVVTSEMGTLWDTSAVVARVRVSEVHAVGLPTGGTYPRVFSRIHAAVLTTYRGKNLPHEINFLQRAGELNVGTDVTVRVDGRPPLEPGEYIVFLRYADGIQQYVLNGDREGAFGVRAGRLQPAGEADLSRRYAAMPVERFDSELRAYAKSRPQLEAQ